MALTPTKRNRRERYGRTPAAATGLENLHARLVAGGGLRPRDALLLRRLGVPPFADSVVYELDRRGYVVGVGLPESLTRVDQARLKIELETRFGVPAATLALARVG